MSHNLLFSDIKAIKVLEYIVCEKSDYKDLIWLGPYSVNTSSARMLLVVPLKLVIMAIINDIHRDFPFAHARNASALVVYPASSSYSQLYTSVQWVNMLSWHPVGGVYYMKCCGELIMV